MRVRLVVVVAAVASVDRPPRLAGAEPAAHVCLVVGLVTEGHPHTPGVGL